MGTVVSKSELRQQFIDAFEVSGCSADDCLANIKIQQEPDGVMVDIEAEVYFDQNEVLLDYSEYKSIMEEVGQSILSKSEYYNSMRNQPTLVDKMDAVIQQYNPDWYFELYNACHIQAYLDNCILEV